MNVLISIKNEKIFSGDISDPSRKAGKWFNIVGNVGWIFFRDISKFLFPSIHPLKNIWLCVCVCVLDVFSSHHRTIFVTGIQKFIETLKLFFWNWTRKRRYFSRECLPLWLPSHPGVMLYLYFY